MLETVTAYYENNGPGMEVINLFTVLFSLRGGQSRTINELCQANKAFSRSDNADLRDVLRRRISSQLTRAARNLLVEKVTGAGGSKNGFVITERGQQHILSGLEARASFIKQKPNATLAQACADASLNLSVNTAEVTRRFREDKKAAPSPAGTSHASKARPVVQDPLAAAWFPMPPAHVSLHSSQVHAEG